MLLGLNKENVKNVTQIETKSIFTIKMNFSEMYSWSYSLWDYSKVTPEPGDSERRTLRSVHTNRVSCKENQKC